VSGIGDGSVDLTIRKVGRVTAEVFLKSASEKVFLRGPYGNGFDVELFEGKELFVIAGGTGVSPVRGVVDYFATHSDKVTSLTFIAGFKTPSDVLFRNDFPRWNKTANIILTTDDNCGNASYKKGLVTEYIPSLEVKDIANAQAVVVGPPAMMRFATKALLERGLLEKNIWVSYERRMCCGVGKCGHCRINDKYVCADGPVFNFTEGKLLVD
jgi:anaerobic sulfite reductase subunit B